MFWPEMHKIKKKTPHQKGQNATHINGCFCVLYMFERTFSFLAGNSGQLTHTSTHTVLLYQRKHTHLLSPHTPVPHTLQCRWVAEALTVREQRSAKSDRSLESAACFKQNHNCCVLPANMWPKKAPHWALIAGRAGLQSELVEMFGHHPTASHPSSLQISRVSLPPLLQITSDTVRNSVDCCWYKRNTSTWCSVIHLCLG